jgi:hypothetical protein
MNDDVVVGYYCEGIVVCVHCANYEELKYGLPITRAGADHSGDFCCECEEFLNEVEV